MHLLSPGQRSRCLRDARADAILNFGEYFQCFDWLLFFFKASLEFPGNPLDRLKLRKDRREFVLL